jgi:circadian clock protein KaiC
VEGGPALTRGRAGTGIDGLDALIEGGFQERKAYLICGEPGTGKTTFCLQFLMKGLGLGEAGVYVTVDEKPSHLIEDAKSMGWDLTSYLDRKELLILDASPYFTNLRLGKEKELDVRQIVSDLSKHVKSLGARRLVIDPVAPLIFKDESQAVVMEYIRSLIFSIEDNLGCTALFTSHMVTGSDRLSRFGVEEFIVSGIVLLRIVRAQNRYIRTLFVRKMRGTAIDLTEYSFDIVRGRGIVLRQAV